ncbi:uncharacterized protein [Drosophila pseudoobscura]|uniref:Uncharacterized protein n=1 Tax=Drosophila pseudoobscura pseudoobscura TaxID=46245 RepID=A0A6I8VAC4_DROPS|nr:uncharacterized protein LOC6897093 [Drosophila pseudoobscura]XP_033233067.1 uncharacterized protein LOC6897093 [Drosophila pseudoobscura]
MNDSDSDDTSFHSFDGSELSDFFNVSSCSSDEDEVPLYSKNKSLRKLPPVPYELPSVEVFSLNRASSMLKESIESNTNRPDEAKEKNLPTDNSQNTQPECFWSPRKQFDLVLKSYFRHTKPVEEEYVSPFKPNMSIQPRPKESPLLKGLKKPIVLPAGYDLSALQVIKDPNHWAIRPGVRTGDIIK